MNDNVTRPFERPGEHFPDDFARRVIVKARDEQSQRRRRGVAVASLILMMALLPLGHALRLTPEVAAQSEVAWQDYSSKATELAAATAPDELSDYLAPEAVRMNQWSGGYSDASWQYDSDGESE